MSRPVLTGIVRAKAFFAVRDKVGFGKEARHLCKLLSNEMVESALSQVAKAKGVPLPEGDVGAEGDHPILDFINVHWADILAILLKFLGL